MKKDIGIIGLGKLGLCLALNLERIGYQIEGIERNENLVKLINSKSLKSDEPFVEDYLKKSKNLTAASEIKEDFLKKCNFIFIVVATPSLSDGGYDHSQIDAIISQLISFGKQQEEKHLIINCTTMPGYCQELSEKLKSYNYSLSYNPEFIAQGSIIQDQQSPDQVLIGSQSKAAISQLKEIYYKLCKNNPRYCVMDLTSAEITKLATNCFLTTKISFANTIGDLARDLGADSEKILQAIGSDSRIGEKYLKYGFGFGGPCFPRDNRALIKFAQDKNHELPLSRATDLANQQHLDFQFKQWMKIPKNETIDFNQVSYKPGTAIIEESQQLALAVKLAKAGRKVRIIEDPKVLEQIKEIYANLFTYSTRDGSK